MLFSSYRNLPGLLPRGVGLQVLWCWFLAAPAGCSTPVYISKSKTASLSSNCSGCQTTLPQRSLDEPGMVSTGFKYRGGKILRNKFHSLISYLLSAAACKGAPECFFSQASDCVYKQFLHALMPKFLVHSFRQAAQVPVVGPTPPWAFPISSVTSRPTKGWLGSFFYKTILSTQGKNVCVSLWACMEVHVCARASLQLCRTIWCCLKMQPEVFKSEEHNIWRGIQYPAKNIVCLIWEYLWFKWAINEHLTALELWSDDPQVALGHAAWSSVAATPLKIVGLSTAEAAWSARLPPGTSSLSSAWLNALMFPKQWNSALLNGINDIYECQIKSTCRLSPTF